MSGGLRTEEGKEKGTRQRRQQEGGTKAGEAKGDQTRQRRGGRAENSRELGTGRGAEGGRRGRGGPQGFGEKQEALAAWPWKKPGRTLTYFFLGRSVCCQSYCGDSPVPR